MIITVLLIVLVLQLMSHLQEQMSLVLRTLMQNPETRHELLSWLAGCLSANAGRRKLWASQMPALFHQVRNVTGHAVAGPGYVCVRLYEFASPGLIESAVRVLGEELPPGSFRLHEYYYVASVLYLVYLAQIKIIIQD